MQVFLTRAYERLKKDAGRGKPLAPLRDSCDAASDALAAGNGGGSLVGWFPITRTEKAGQGGACGRARAVARWMGGARRALLSVPAPGPSTPL